MMFSIWRAVRAYEKCVKVLDLSLVFAGVPSILVDRLLQCLDGSVDAVEGCEDLL